MKTRIRQFRRLVAIQTRRQSGRRRYFPEIREEAVAIARALAQPVSRTARELGIPEVTLYAWLRSAPTAMRPVAIRPGPPSAPVSTLVLVTSAGLRVEGLDVPSAAALLKALS